MDNIENKIKQEFQNREIKPSKSAWEVLNAQLEVSTTKKENKKLRFLAYAAVFIGLLFGLTLFLNGNKKTSNTPVIVKENTIPKIEKSKFNDNNKTEQIPNTVQENTKIVIVKTEVKSVKVKSKTKSVKQQFQQKFVQSEDNNVVASQTKPNETIVNSVVVNTSNNALLANNTNPNKQTPNPKQQTPNTKQQTPNPKPKKKLFSTDADIDLLLATALNKTANNSVREVKIQSSHLQYAVESEINIPIGNKILKTLRAGVDTVEEYITSNN